MNKVYVAFACWCLTGCNPHPVVPFDEVVIGERRDPVLHQRPKVDVLWVVDNSSSMEQEQASLRDNFELFIDEMAAADADFHLAVVTTDMDPWDGETLAENRGRFQNLPDGRPTSSGQGGADVGHCPGELPLIIRSDAYRAQGVLDGDSLKRDFGCMATVGLRGSGFEQGLEAALTALSPALATTHNAGFLRDDAHLAIVFVTDENDCSDRGAVERHNGNECEYDADLLVPVDEYARAFRALKPADKKVIVAGIFAPDTGARAVRPNQIDKACNAPTGVAYSGWRYDLLVQAVGGITANICDPPFTRALAEVAAVVGDALRETCLSEVPACQLDEDCVRIELHRSPDAPPLEGARCEPARAGRDQVCILRAGEHYTIDYGASCGVAVTMAVETQEGDRVVARYQR